MLVDHEWNHCNNGIYSSGRNQYRRLGQGIKDFLFKRCILYAGELVYYDAVLAVFFILPDSTIYGKIFTDCHVFRDKRDYYLQYHKRDAFVVL